jgi:hypothetical protein
VESGSHYTSWIPRPEFGLYEKLPNRVIGVKLKGSTAVTQDLRTDDRIMTNDSPRHIHASDGEASDMGEPTSLEAISAITVEEDYSM